MTDYGQLLHGGPKVVHHERLVVDHALPLASRAAIPSEREIGLKTHLALEGKRRVDLGASGVIHAEGDADPSEQDLKEDLGVEGEGGLLYGGGSD